MAKTSRKLGTWFKNKTDSSVIANNETQGGYTIDTKLEGTEIATKNKIPLTIHSGGIESPTSAQSTLGNGGASPASARSIDRYRLENGARQPSTKAKEEEDRTKDRLGEDAIHSSSTSSSETIYPSASSGGQSEGDGMVINHPARSRGDTTLATKTTASPRSHHRHIPQVVSSTDMDSTKDYALHDLENAQHQGSQTYLNSLFNGHLMKWKFESEEGTGFVRIPAFCGGLGLVSTSIAALALNPLTWTASNYVITGFVLVISFVILVLDGRFLSSSPLSWRAHLRNVITRHFNIFRYLWGRALLYVAGGLLSCALLQPITIISGAVMVLIGFIALCIGSHASRKFSALKNSLADESFLLLEFSNLDYDDDGYLSATEFSFLLQALGMQLDDRYSLKAFNAIDTDHDRKISFDEFSQWWTQGYIERGRKEAHGCENSACGEDYRRLS